MKRIFKIENLIYLTIFLLPAYLIKLKIFGLPTNMLEILIAVSLIWALFSKPISKNLLKLGLGMAIGLIFAGLILSILVNKNYAIGFGILKSWFILPLLFSIITLKVVPEEKKENIFIAYYFSAVTMAILGIVYFFLGKVTYDGRLEIIFNSPNYLAMYLGPAIIIGALLFPGNKKRYLLSMVILIAAFYLTFSYAAWISVLSVLALVTIIKGKRQWLWAILTMAVLAIIFQVYTVKLGDLVRIQERSSLASRIMIWRASEKILDDNWLWGIGPGNFQNKYLEYQKYFPPYLEWAVPHPHNLYLNFWIAGGIISLVGFIYLLSFWAKDVLKNLLNADNCKLVAAAVVFYMLIHGLVDTTYFKNDLAVVFWLSFWLAL